MRLDHLLSKENRVFVLSLCGCLVRHLVVASFLFAGEDKYRMHVLCVVWELMRQRFFAVFQLVGWRV